MTKATLVFAAALASLVCLGAQGKTASTGGSTYSDAKFGFSVQILPGFKREGNPDPMGSTQFSGPVVGGRASTISVIGFPCENETAESIGKAAVAQVQGDENYKVVSSGPLKPGGVAGFTWLYERKVDGGAVVMQRSFVSVKKGIAAVVTVIIEKSGFDRFDKSSLELINTFKWTK